jgi:hypothetical protein
VGLNGSPVSSWNSSLYFSDGDLDSSSDEDDRELKLAETALQRNRNTFHDEIDLASRP